LFAFSIVPIKINYNSIGLYRVDRWKKSIFNVVGSLFENSMYELWESKFLFFNLIMANSKLKNGIFRTTVITMVLMLVLFVVLQFRAKSYIENFLSQKIPDHIRLTYDQIEVNLPTASFGLTNVALVLSDRESNDKQVVTSMEAIEVKGLGYYRILFENTISFDEVRFLRPKAEYYVGDHKADNHEVAIQNSTKEKKLFIAALSIVDGEFNILGKGGDSTVFSTDNLNISMRDIQMDKDTKKRKIPFLHGEYNLSTGKVFADLGPFEAMTLGGISIRNKELQLSNLSLKSKYNKTDLSKKLAKEHDYIDLEIPEINVRNMDFGFNFERFFLKTNRVTIQKPEMEIYRDKLVPDDWEEKKLYSRMLRELPIDLDVSEIEISNGYIAYSELVKSGTVPGEIVFSELEATLSHVSNTLGSEEKTEIKAVAQLMEDAPIELIWSFDSSNENDAFLVSGVVKNFKSQSINQFLKSNLRAEAEGDVQELYFTVSGDAISASGDMKMSYEDFRFKVLKKDRLGVNKLLTFVGNIFTNDGSKTDNMGYRYGEIYAERDNTKSFFNYLWLNVMDGIISTLTGDGKKE
jgi:hypothetical protein